VCGVGSIAKITANIRPIARRGGVAPLRNRAFHSAGW
jgi:hypothetical protein